MGLIDAIPVNGQPASNTPTPKATPVKSGGGLIDLVKPQNQPQGTPQPLHVAIPPSPATQAPGSQFYSTPPTARTSFQPSVEKDTSGLPYLSYKPAQVPGPSTLETKGQSPNFSQLALKPGLAAPSNGSPTKEGITDYTRVATKFDPRVAQPLEKGSFTTPRALADRAALKTAMGGTYSTELDHAIALELGGSNNKANLQIEPDVPGTKNTATDPLENQLAKEVVSGQKSLFQAQWELAKTKGTPLPYLGDTVNKFEELAYDSKKAADYAQSPLGIAENTIGSIGNTARDILGILSKQSTTPFSGLGPTNAPRTPGQFGVPEIATKSMAAAGVSAQAVVSHPVLFSAGFTDELVKALAGVRSLTSLAMNIPDAGNQLEQLHQRDVQTLTRNATSPEEQMAVTAGRFAAWMIPYGVIAHGVEAGLGAGALALSANEAGGATITPTIQILGKIIPYVADLSGFLGTGQVLHDPTDSSRLDQLKNDAITLSFFWGGGFGLKVVAPAIVKGVAKMLSPAAQQNVKDAMHPIIDQLKNGGSVTVDQLDHATVRANTIIEDETGKTPKELVQMHLGLSSETGADTGYTPEELHGLRKELAKPYKPGEQPKDQTANVIPLEQAHEEVTPAIHNQAGILHQNAVEYQPHFEAMVDSLAKENGWQVDHGPVKTHFAIGKKAATEYRANGGVGRVGDANRTTIVVHNRAELSKAEAAVTDHFGEPTRPVKNGFKTNPDGSFKSINIKVKGAGEGTHEAEIQITTPEMYKAKTELGGHRLYKENTSAARLRSDTLYREAEAANKRRFASSSERGSPSAAALTGGYDEPVKRTVPESLPPDKSTRTSVPSTSKNSGYERDIHSSVPDNTSGRKSLELPAIPERGVTLHGGAFPGAGAISAFIEKDIVGKFGTAKKALIAIYEASKALFAPPNLAKRTAAAITASELTQVEQAASSAWKAAEGRWKWWDSMPTETQLDFSDRFDRGEKTFEGYSPAMQRTLSDMGQLYSERLDRTWDFELGLKATKAARDNYAKRYILDYFPRRYVDSEGVQAFFQQRIDAFGKGWFTKQRAFELERDALAAGFELRTSNPEERVLTREIDSQRVAAKIRIVQQLQESGLAHPIEKEFVPNGFDEKGQTVWEKNPAYSAARGARLAGWPLIIGADGKQYAVTPDAKRILDNAFFSKNLWTMPGILQGAKNEGMVGALKGAGPTMFRSLMRVKGTVVPAILSLSGFHTVHEIFINSSSRMANALEAVIKGGIKPNEAGYEFVKALSQVSIAKDVFDKWDIVKNWNTPMDQLSEESRTEIQWMIDGAITPHISDEFRIKAMASFTQAVRDENYIGAGIRILPKVLEAQQHMLMGWIPKAKAASYLQAAKNAVAANPELLTNDIARKAAFYKIGRDMDYRFGQVNYKALFWNPILKQSMQAGMLSLGWTGGFVDQFGGAIKDAITLGIKAPQGKATLDDVTNRMLFASIYAGQAALVGGLMTYFFTGKIPQKVEDFFFPNTGATNPDGSPARLNTSFYTREAFSLVYHWQSQGYGGGSLAMAENKASPVLSTLAYVMNNKDFYGYEIQDTHAPAATRAEQVLAFLMKSATPISMQGAAQAEPVTGKEGEVLSYLGFNPAPKYIAQSTMQTKINAALDQRTGGTKPLAQKPAQDAKNNIRTLYEQGKLDQANQALEAAVKAGYIKESGRATFIKSLDLPGDVRAFKTLQQYPSDQENLLAQMSEEELARYANYAASSVKAHLSSLSPTTKKFVDDLHAGKVQLVEFKAGKAVEQSTP